MVYKFKKGHKIHIKKENRGKFTDYCGGEVTNECIQRGKNSSNPVIRKRATFADNARKWKHQNGGVVLKSQLGTKINNIVSKVGDFYKKNKNTIDTIYNAGKDAYSQYKEGMDQAKAINEQRDQMYNYLEYQKQKALAKNEQRINAYENYIQQLQDPSNPLNGGNANTFGGTIFANYMKGQADQSGEINKNFDDLESTYNNYFKKQRQQAKSNAITGAFTGLVNTGIQTLGKSNFGKSSEVSNNISKDIS